MESQSCLKPLCSIPSYSGWYWVGQAPEFPIYSWILLGIAFALFTTALKLKQEKEKLVSCFLFPVSRFSFSRFLFSVLFPVFLFPVSCRMWCGFARDEIFSSRAFRHWCEISFAGKHLSAHSMRAEQQTNAFSSRLVSSRLSSRTHS